MKVIWEEVVEEKRKAVAKLGRTVEEVVATTPRQVGYFHIGIAHHPFCSAYLTGQSDLILVVKIITFIFSAFGEQDCQIWYKKPKRESQVEKTAANSIHSKVQVTQSDSNLRPREHLDF